MDNTVISSNATVQKNEVNIEPFYSIVNRSNATVKKNEVNRKPVLIVYTGKALFVATSLGLAMMSEKPTPRIG